MFIEDKRYSMLSDLLDMAECDPDLDTSSTTINRYREALENRDIFDVRIIIERSRNGRDFCDYGKAYLEAACKIIDDGVMPDILELKIEHQNPAYW